MELYVGMDVSLKETSICVVDGNGGHCQTNLNGPSKGAGLRRSGRQLTPFSERGSAVLFEDIAAVEVAVLVEVVVD